MDESTREMLAAAFALDDEMQRQYYRNFGESADETQRAPTRQPKPVKRTPQPQQQQSAQMDAATGEKWNEWVQAHIARALDEYTAMMEEEIAQFASEYVTQRLAAETTKLREEIASLRADMTVQVGVAKGEIAEIKRAV